METIEFKKLFGSIAKEKGFERAFEGWFKEFSNMILVLDLQKSNYSCLFYLNIKLYIQGVFGKRYLKSKGLVKGDIGNIFLRQPHRYSELFDLEFQLDDHLRKEKLNKMFDDFIVPFSLKVATIEGIKELHTKGELFILPAVKEELGIV